MTTIAVQTRTVTVGIDTHKDTHVAAVLDGVGRMLGSWGFPTDPAGNAALIRWAEEHGSITEIGVEGTGSYGAQLSRDLQQAGYHVIEVDRPARKARRLHGKDDHLDAEAAARAVLSGRADTIPKARDGQIEAIRALRVALQPLVTAAAPALVSRFAVGTDTAGALLVAVGDNPGRLRNESSFAHLCGVAPLPASSGKTSGRYRLNRGGDRRANKRSVVHRVDDHGPCQRGRRQLPVSSQRNGQRDEVGTHRGLRRSDCRSPWRDDLDHELELLETARASKAHAVSGP